MTNIPHNPQKMAQDLLHWYAQFGREMPWRTKGGAHSNAYAVWISEIMLQQTTVATVGAYFTKWMTHFPTIDVLAKADIKDVLLLWQGLGYYTRAKKIHACAQEIMAKYNGKIPQNRALLLKLPGIGPYSASSICAFAFNMPETVVDANVVRVIARVYGIQEGIKKDTIYQLAEKITPPSAPADYASAIMDLGATVCKAKSPLCQQCPWGKYCIAYHHNLTSSIPNIKKPLKKEKSAILYLIKNDKNAYYIEKRAGKGLLSGLYEFPWYEHATPPFPANWQTLPFKITHTFTHFHLTLTLKTTFCPNPPLKNGKFVPPTNFKNYPFSTLMKKVIKKMDYCGDTL